MLYTIYCIPLYTMLLQMPENRDKGMVIAAATLTSANTYPCLILTKHLIQIST